MSNVEPGDRGGASAPPGTPFGRGSAPGSGRAGHGWQAGLADAWVRPLCWLAAAFLLMLPTSLQPWAMLLGDSRADVWNHAWGYFYVADALWHGHLPFHTDLAGGPAGGALYFIDCAGALAATPLTWLLGPAVSYNLWQGLRLATAGFAAQLLCDEVVGRGPRGWFAGLAFMTSPYLLCELADGITEAVPVAWIPLTLWAAARALRLGRTRDWALFGVVLGLTGVVSFYYGLSTGILVATLLALVLAVRWVRRRRVDPRTVVGIALAGGLALALSGSAWWVFKATLDAPDALIVHAPSNTAVLLAHNAADPRTYIMPGAFQSADLHALYGEAFLHTSYLRWSVILLAAVGISAAGRRLLPWLPVALVAAVLGLGSYLWYDGHPVLLPGGRPISLPFEWLLHLLPRVSITHAQRMSVGAHAILAVAAGAGAQALVARGAARWRAPILALLAGVTVAEALWGSLAVWPLPRASAAIPAFYAAAGEGMILDLPAQAGRTMDTSRYFWYQTLHRRPIPYTPDIRLGSMRDRTTLEALRDASAPVQQSERPRPLSGEVLQYWRGTYGMIVVHQGLEQQAGLAGRYRAAWVPALGEPCALEDALVWYLRDQPCPK